MTRRRIVRILALALMLTSFVVGFLPAPSSAEAPQATGWWSRRLPLQGEVTGQSARQPVRYTPAASPQQDLPDPTIPVDTTVPGSGPVTTLPLPVPIPPLPEPPITLPEEDTGTPNPTVPEGGLWVANDPTGPIALSALRYRGDIGSGTLTLRFAPGSTTVGPVVACPALSAFDPIEGGAWADRPAHDCDRLELGGRLTPDGTGLEFTIPQGFLPFGERVLDIVILPARSSGDPFSLYFQPPDAESLDVSQGQLLAPPIADLAEPEPLDLPEPVATDTSFDTGGTEFTDLPVEVTTPPETAPTEEAPSAVSPIADVLEPFIESRTGRIIAVAVLLGMGAGLWYFGGQPIRHPQLLGAMAGDTPVLFDQAPDAGRGIGRFQRIRTGPPGRL